MQSFQKEVTDFIKLINSRKDIEDSIKKALKNSDLPEIKTLENFYEFLNGILTNIPSEKELMPSVRKFYFILGNSPDDFLKKDEEFNNWLKSFVESRGNFMDSIESAKNLDSFIQNPKYNIDDYYLNPSGWLTYNQFLARQVKPGRRPIEGLCNDDIIVSPADSEFYGYHNIGFNSEVVAKGVSYSIIELIQGSNYADEFKDGIFTHSFLGIEDYHRFHLPIGGNIKEVKKITASTWINEEKKFKGEIENIDDTGFQFSHTRGYVIIDSPIGLVAIIPVGMGHISSVNFTLNEGTNLVKGQEIGFFAFGGSDIIMLFQKDKIKFTAIKNEHYKQGQQIAVAVHTS